ncbi:transcriptional regulator TetR family [Patulibacter medicamentivorans]|uniref:Transcriptional regulator TetR family n=1 Tax=Patulibacter medicamentivorans TaxID=1097667 RepID=H0E463_9ACTN|nr:TetR/AcrR family transcriptional regulator [Patulibacter medicamentivorans]EHN11530.1 transcriptional regulator TetR family [Patulibacter medicamentivorans]
MANDATKTLATDKALRIVDAMRSSVSRRGVAGSTFDHVAREAGVSRGLLHYYFGSKERLLVEVAKRDSEVRLEAMSGELARAANAEDLGMLWVRSLYATVRHEPAFVSLLLELYTLAQRMPEIADELSAMTQAMTDAFAQRLQTLVDDGRITIGAAPEVVADVVIGFGHGLALRFMSNPEADMEPVVEAAKRAVGALVRNGPKA